MEFLLCSSDRVIILCLEVFKFFFNKSWSNIFPELRKLCTVTPTFKDGDRCQLSNYRLISKQNVMSKIFENIIADKLSSLFKNVLANNMDLCRVDSPLLICFFTMITLTSPWRKIFRLMSFTLILQKLLTLLIIQYY